MPVLIWSVCHPLDQQISVLIANTNLEEVVSIAWQPVSGPEGVLSNQISVSMANTDLFGADGVRHLVVSVVLVQLLEICDGMCGSNGTFCMDLLSIGADGYTVLLDVTHVKKRSCDSEFVHPFFFGDYTFSNKEVPFAISVWIAKINVSGFIDGC